MAVNNLAVIMGQYHDITFIVVAAPSVIVFKPIAATPSVTGHLPLWVLLSIQSNNSCM